MMKILWVVMPGRNSQDFQTEEGDGSKLSIEKETEVQTDEVSPSKIT